MYRTATQKLQQWKQKSDRKPLIIRGARQVGKTWLMREFGDAHYASVAYISLEGNRAIKNLFELDYDIDRIISGLEVETNTRIIPGDTLIILDEIQEVPRALTALKYFYENSPEYHIVVAGSLLGVAMHGGTSFPVGKVEFLDLYPLTFYEFLKAQQKDKLLDMLQGDRKELEEGIFPFHDTLLDILKTYYITGGMPEVVEYYRTHESLIGIRDIQNRIIASYEQDFSKHAPLELVPKLREIWDILPAQLARENKKFIFRYIRHGARAKEYEGALLWLEDAGLVTRVARINKPALPLSAYSNLQIFKLFMLDIGLLGAKSGLEPDVILEDTAVFEEFKGALAEQYVFQELKMLGINLFYYAQDDSRGEIDFMLQRHGEVIPIEIKSGKNAKARSLTNFTDKHKSKTAVIFSTLPQSHKGSRLRLPLYMAESIDRFLK